MNRVPGKAGAMRLSGPARYALIPLAVFAVLVVLFAFSLAQPQQDKKKIPSPLIGKPAPQFMLPVLGGDGRMGTDDMKGQVWLLNVWATWCAACAIEHPVLNQLAATGKVVLVGLNWKDDTAAALRWLAQRGDPYVFTVVDRQGDVAIDYGVVAAPETFVIDRQGVIRHKHLGVINARVAAELLEWVGRLTAETEVRR